MPVTLIPQEPQFYVPGDENGAGAFFRVDTDAQLTSKIEDSKILLRIVLEEDVDGFYDIAMRIIQSRPLDRLSDQYNTIVEVINASQLDGDMKTTLIIRIEAAVFEDEGES